VIALILNLSLQKKKSQIRTKFRVAHQMEKLQLLFIQIQKIYFKESNEFIQTILIFWKIILKYWNWNIKQFREGNTLIFFLKKKETKMKSTFGILFLLGLFLFLGQGLECIIGCETCEYNGTYCLTLVLFLFLSYFLFFFFFFFLNRILSFKFFRCSSGYFYTEALHTCTGACPNGYYLNNANCAGRINSKKK